MKTFQSMTSLGTSPAHSSYSLYSNGFVITNKPFDEEQNYDDDELSVENTRL